MSYNPEIHHRRSIRLWDFDYSGAGAYFITICTHERESVFGNLVDGVMRLNYWGLIVRECWEHLPNHFSQVALDEFVVMPNHVHGIIILNHGLPNVGARHASPCSRITPDCGSDENTRATHASPLRESGSKSGSIAAIVGSFKSAVTRRINQTRQAPGGSVWQRNYYERVIRDDRELNNIRQYIEDNPRKWADDENHPTYLHDT